MKVVLELSDESLVKLAYQIQRLNDMIIPECGIANVIKNPVNDAYHSIIEACSMINIFFQNGYENDSNPLDSFYMEG